LPLQCRGIIDLKAMVRRGDNSGGDFGLYLGADVSIGYSNHDDKVIRLYLQETFTFLLLTTEASVALTPNAGKAKP
jgi:uncharacterized linocin/CFP29 family protein